MSDDVTAAAVDQLNARVGIDFSAPEWHTISPALSALAMRERAFQVSAPIAKRAIFFPEERTGYTSNEHLATAVEKTVQEAIRSYPIASGDVVTALAYTVMQYKSIIVAAKSRWADVPAIILAAITKGKDHE